MNKKLWTALEREVARSAVACPDDEQVMGDLAAVQAARSEDRKRQLATYLTGRLGAVGDAADAYSSVAWSLARRET